MTDASSFAKMVPGFDFLQGLVKNAGAALPGIGQWVAPTLNPEELEKRISELRTVQFWLEQNARMLGATIQALEVQRMTLSTLKSMNVQMEDLRDSMTIRMPGSAAPERAEQASTATPKPTADAAARAASAAAGTNAQKGAATPVHDAAQDTASAAPPAVDPMQWWGALTKQFTELAAHAMTDSNADAAKTLAESVVKQGFDAASETFKKAVSATSPSRASPPRTSAAGETTRKPRSQPAGKSSTQTAGKAASNTGRKVASQAATAAPRKAAAKPGASRKR